MSAQPSLSEMLRLLGWDWDPAPVQDPFVTDPTPLLSGLAVQPPDSLAASPVSVDHHQRLRI